MTEAPPLPTNFVFLATDRAGQRRYVESRGGTVDAARYALEVQGFTDAKVVQDDFDQLLARVNKSSAFAGDSVHERVEFQRRAAKNSGVVFVLKEVFKTNWVFILLLAGTTFARATGAHPLSVSSLIVYAAAIGFLVIVIRGLVPVRLYNQLLEARAWRRWDEARRIVRSIRSLRWLTGSNGIPEYDLRFTEAKVLAAKGEIEAAVAWVQYLEHDPAFSRRLYLSLLAGVYEVAERPAERLACAEQSFAIAPDSATAIIDFSITQIDCLGDAVRGRATLEKLVESEVKDSARGFYDFAWGRIWLVEGDYAGAEAAFARAVAGQDQVAGNPIAQAARRVFQGYHAVALKKLGRQFEAEEEMGKVLRFLEATRNHRLLRCWVEA